MGVATPQEVISFWVDEVGPPGWYKQAEDLDTEIRRRFMETWEAAWNGDLYDWSVDQQSVLGFVIVTDQFPRNMFRGDERSFATDSLARSGAKRAIDRRWDLTVAEPQRQFFYLPLMHSETLTDQDRCIRLFADRMPETGADNLHHARAHREIIRKFGRFPFRNAALGRMTLPAEAAFLEAGGYAGVLQSLAG